MSAPTIAVLDVDGTLVDTNYQHALAWYRALRSLGGDDVEERIGDEARERWTAEFDELIDEVAPLPGAKDLVAALVERGHRVVLASSGKAKHVEHFIDLVGVRDLVEDWTTSDDVESSKPEPDLLQVALEKIGEPADAPSVMIGDSVFDVQAATKAGMPTIVVRSGGFGDDELREAGAVAIYDTPAELTDALDGTALA